MADRIFPSLIRVGGGPGGGVGEPDPDNPYAKYLYEDNTYSGVCRDSSPNGRHATYANILESGAGPLHPASPIPLEESDGGCVHLDGVDDCVITPIRSNTEMYGLNPIAFEVMFRDERSGTSDATPLKVLLDYTHANGSLGLRLRFRSQDHLLGNHGLFILEILDGDVDVPLKSIHMPMVSQPVVPLGHPGFVHALLVLSPAGGGDVDYELWASSQVTDWRMIGFDTILAADYYADLDQIFQLGARGDYHPDHFWQGEIDDTRLYAYDADEAVARAHHRWSFGVPVPYVSPSLSGTPEVGEIVTCDPGEWSGMSPPDQPAFSFQYQRTNALGNWVNIAGAVAQQYTLTASENGRLVRCIVTANNGVDPMSSWPSNQIGPVAP